MRDASADLPEPAKSQLGDTFALWTEYVAAFRHCARACFAVRYQTEQPSAARAHAAHE